MNNQSPNTLFNSDKYDDTQLQAVTQNLRERIIAND